jgi:hypothetical protein
MTQAALGIPGMMFNVGSLPVLTLLVAACRLLAFDTAAIPFVDGQRLRDGHWRPFAFDLDFYHRASGH